MLYANKPTESARPPSALWFRWMFVLLLIGLVHAYLIWPGDILVPYGLCGLVPIWWMRNLTARTLLVSAIVMLSVGAASPAAALSGPTGIRDRSGARGQPIQIAPGGPAVQAGNNAVPHSPASAIPVWFPRCLRQRPLPQLLEKLQDRVVGACRPPHL